ncbi:hypothetical protein [Nocardia callitridis]|uniref:50S ribosomal protein L32 n=1 Tax=Nocardia callitridis TaxID=648753 RepID=A0ABP9KHS0_9NOCA
MNKREPLPDPQEKASERADLVAWRRRDALRRGNAAQPLANKRRYRRGSKHKNRTLDA